MRIAIVGPAHPFKGGVAQHTTILAQRLTDAGHDVEIASWSRQYPDRLYPGQQTIRDPEFPPFPATSRLLAWNGPGTWVREARRLRSQDLVIFAHITPVQVLPYRTMIRVVRGATTRTAVICHNVLPHERSRVDTHLAAWLLRATDLVVVHSAAEANVARSLTSRRVVVAQLAPFMPTGFLRQSPKPGVHRRLLFFGLVRPYKGLDILLRSLARIPDVQLRVAGEFWGGVEETLELCRELGISDRVEILNGYVPADAVPTLFDDVDALVLPYRSATGSQAAWTGFQFGVPVIATNAGHLADDIDPGVDGLIANANDEDSLANAVIAFYRTGVPESLREGVRAVDPAPLWHRYVNTLLTGLPTA